MIILLNSVSWCSPITYFYRTGEFAGRRVVLATHVDFVFVISHGHDIDFLL